MARRFIYKVKGPEACNFPVTPALAAELDALTVEQIQKQFKQVCGKRQGVRGFAYCRVCTGARMRRVQSLCAHICIAAGGSGSTAASSRA